MVPVRAFPFPPVTHKASDQKITDLEMELNHTVFQAFVTVTVIVFTP